MRIRPEARQLLESGFQRRIDEQKRRFAMQGKMLSNSNSRTTTHPVTASFSPWVLSLLLNQLRVQVSFRSA